MEVGRVVGGGSLCCEVKRMDDICPRVEDLSLVEAIGVVAVDSGE